MAYSKKSKKVGIALGAGSARGWAHIGIFNALKQKGIEPDIVCGTSIGALVGAAYVTDSLDPLAAWVSQLRRRDVASYFDLTFSGGMIQGTRLMKSLEEIFPGDLLIEDLPKPFAAVATELETGNEVWLQSGPLLPALRASFAMPALFTPVCYQGEWLIDGALVNPIPISLCRALGADIVIAVNLDSKLSGRSFRKVDIPPEDIAKDISSESDIKKWIAHVSNRFLTKPKSDGDVPSLFDVLSGSIYIMQDRITRSRMAGDPPDLILSPQVDDIGLLDFDKATKAIEAGYNCVEKMSYLLD